MANVNQRVTDFFIPIARDVIGNNNVFANRQPLETGFPSIVFTFVGESIVPVYGGPMISAELRPELCRYHDDEFSVHRRVRTLGFRL